MCFLHVKAEKSAHFQEFWPMNFHSKADLPENIKTGQAFGGKPIKCAVCYEERIAVSYNERVAVACHAYWVAD